MAEKIEFIIPKSKKEFDYVGVDFNKRQFVFPPKYLDLNTDEEDKETKVQARRIIGLIKRINQEYALGGYNNELNQFHSMIWLIHDYIEKGYYEETERVSKIASNGRINWHKTIKNNKIFFNNGNIIYNKFVRDKINVNQESILAEIYRCCLSFSVARLDFIFGIYEVKRSYFDVVKDKEYLIYCLQRELHSTFNDYKKTLIRHLLAIISNVNENNKNSGYSIYNKDFEYVFESLVNNIFGTDDVKKYYNEYGYKLIDDKNWEPASKLRPDTICKYNEKYYIIDSKYYNYGYSKYPGDLPEASSISKQIGYNHYIRDMIRDEMKKAIEDFKNEDFKDEDVKSVFILPFDKRDDENYFKYIGVARAKNNEKDNENDNDKVDVVLMDLKYLIDSYLDNSDKVEIRKELIETIQNSKKS